jgi:5S rRNA maturation endonuclease (ribonuclease M5)
MLKLSDKIYNASDNGREIILEYYPEARKAFEAYPKKVAFKIRDEATPSAYVKQNQNNIWLVADFGDDQKAHNAIGVVMKEEGVDFVEALSILAKKYGLTTEKPEAKTKFSKPKPKEKPGTYYTYNDTFTENELAILGPKVTANICERYNLKSCKSYTMVLGERPDPKNKNKTLPPTKVTIESSDNYPIFVIDYKDWQKRYKPLSQDKSKRFRHSGTKPTNFIHGLELLKRVKKEYAKQVKEEWDYDKGDPKPKDLKLDNVLIMSGERDAINAASFGYNVVWKNSETDKLTFTDYTTLKECAKNIYVLYDIDNTGKEKAVELALEYTDIKIIWLPKWLSVRKDFRGKPRKDFRDLVQLSYHKGNENVFEGLFKKMVNNAFPMRFWDEKWYKKRGTDEWACKYEFNNAFAMHFIEHQGFYTYEDPESKEDYEFIKVSGNVVQYVKGHHIKKHLHHYLERKNHNIDLRNMLHRTNQLSDKALSQITTFNAPFKKGYVNSQYFFFKNKTWYITKTGVKEYKQGEVSTYVWQNDIIDFQPKVENKYFTITGNHANGWDIEIHNQNCMFLNYLINTSRVHWKDELQKPFLSDKGLNREAQNEYHNNNRFNISGLGLTEDQTFEQKQHLVNKIFAIGYLLHSFKDVTASWFVWNMDYELVDDLESNGGTGKSLFFKLLMPILKNVKKLDGREKGLVDKDFLLDGVTSKTDLVLFEDMDAYFRFHRLLNFITDDMSVNPKGQKPYTISHTDSAKLGGTSNFGIGNMDGTAMRRLLFVATSDYYHEQGDKYLESRQVSDDFKGKRLIDDFTAEDWNMYYNFCAQCISFYLTAKKRINPPLENITKRNLVRDMKSPFKNWADMFFSESNLDIEVHKNEAYENYKKESGQTKATAHYFKKSLKAWCKFMGYEFNPKDHPQMRSDGRIMNKKGHTIPQEYFFIQTSKELTLKEPAPVNDEATVFDEDDSNLKFNEHG